MTAGKVVSAERGDLCAWEAEGGIWRAGIVWSVDSIDGYVTDCTVDGELVIVPEGSLRCVAQAKTLRDVPEAVRQVNAVAPKSIREAMVAIKPFARSLAQWRRAMKVWERFR